MIELSLDFPREDIAAFRDQMNRLINELGKTPEEAARMGMVAALKSMRASTRKGRKFRRMRRSTSARNKRWQGKQLFVMERLDSETGKTSNIPLWFSDQGEAKSYKGRKIRYSGLAKASWGWSMKRLFPNGAGQNNVPRPRRAFMDVSQTGRGRDYAVAVSNDLQYISQTFNTGRGPAVATAMRRAAQTMKGRIDQRLKGALS